MGDREHDTAQEAHPGRSSSALDWTLTLKHVYVNLWQGEGSGQMSRQGVDLQTPDPSSEIEGQSKTCVPVL